MKSKKFIFNGSLILFLFQLIAHCGLIYQIINGTIIEWCITILVYFMTGCFGMTMTFHRLLSHRSWNAPVWFERFGTLCGTWGLTGSSIGWVAIHREHHRYVDTDKDPHSPVYKSFIEIQFLSMFEQPNLKYSANLVKDRFHIILHKYYFFIHLIILGLLLIINPLLAVSCYLAPAAILWNAGSFINTLTHMIGYRNTETKDNSKNIYTLGYLMWGEGWHNNHHCEPSNANFQKKWWEFDMGYMFIRLLSKNRS